MAEFADLGAWALDRLRSTPAVTDLVEGGANMIIEAREDPNLPASLSAAQEARREAGETEKVLAIVVQDFGEKDLVASCGIFIYDRYGYANIRAVREAMITALVNCPVMLVREALINQAHYAGRSGHVIATQFDVDFERVDFSGDIIVENDYYA